MFVLLSIATFCLETDLAFRVQRNSSIPKNSSWTKSEKTLYTEVHPSLDYLDYICIAYFTLEFIVRFAFCPNKATFFKVLLNWVDLLSILPFYFEQLILFIESSLEDSGMIQLLNSMRLIRIFRIFKLTRHFSGLKIIGHTVRASAKELALLIMFMMITVLIFACLIYYAEAVKEHELNKFKTIPVGFWWALVTMTTLGYGDFYPRTGLGYIVGAMCALAGVLVLALPVPIIVNNFSLYYSHAQARAKLPKKRKRVLVGAADALKTQGMDEEANLENVLPGLPPSGPAPPSNAPAAAAVAAPTPARPKSPGSHSNDSVNSETRKGSAESDNSVDSGIKTGDCEFFRGWFVRNPCDMRAGIDVFLFRNIVAKQQMQLTCVFSKYEQRELWHQRHLHGRSGRDDDHETIVSSAQPALRPDAPRSLGTRCVQRRHQSDGPQRTHCGVGGQEPSQ